MKWLEIKFVSSVTRLLIKDYNFLCSDHFKKENTCSASLNPIKGPPDDINVEIQPSIVEANKECKHTFRQNTACLFNLIRHLR